MGLDIVNSPIDFVSSGLNTANSVLGQLFGMANQRRQYKFNSKLQQQAADLQYQTWNNMTENTRNWNEYAEKMSKMAEAGINPLYSEGSAPQAAISSAAPSSSVDGINTPDFNLGDSVTNALRQSELRLKEREIRALEKQSTANAEKAEAETKTIEQVRPHEVNLAIERLYGQKLDNATKEVLKGNIMEELDIKRKTANAAMKSAEAEAVKAAVAKSANEWNESVARQNANSNTANAATNYYNFELADKHLQIEIDKMANEAVQQYHTWLQGLKKNAIETLNEIRDLESFDFGVVKGKLPISIMYRTKAAIEVLNKYINSEEATEEGRKAAMTLMNNLCDRMSEVEAIGLPKNATRPKFKIENGFNPQP